MLKASYKFPLCSYFTPIHASICIRYSFSKPNFNLTLKHILTLLKPFGVRLKVPPHSQDLNLKFVFTSTDVQVHTDTHTHKLDHVRIDYLICFFLLVCPFLIHNALQLRPKSPPTRFLSFPSSLSHLLLLLHLISCFHIPSSSPTTPSTNIVSPSSILTVSIFPFPSCYVLVLFCAVRIQFIHRCTLAGLSQNGRTDGGQKDSNKKCEKADIKNKEHKVTVISDEVWICVQKVITPINNCCYPSISKQWKLHFSSILRTWKVQYMKHGSSGDCMFC